MKIIYHSAVPWVHTGYATCTEEIATRLHNGDHEVAIQSLSSVHNKPIWWYGDDADCELDRRMRVFPSDREFGIKQVKKHFDQFNADIYFTHFDTWMKETRHIIPQMEIPYISYVIVDHKPAPDAVIQQVSDAVETIAMSRFAKNELEKKGVRPLQIPHGVDTSQYYPLTGGDKPTDIEVDTHTASRESRYVDLDDTFLFGMVAANHGARKNIPNHLEAFNEFLNNVDDSAVLYIHTTQNSPNGYDLYHVSNEVGIPDKNLIWARTEDYGDVGNDYLNKWYNAFDVLLNCSFGESWGLTITEAQAAGTPAIVSNFSAMPEQLGIQPGEEQNIEWLDRYENVGIAEHGLLCEPSADYWKTKVDAKHKIVSSDTIFNAMKFYYDNQHLLDSHGNDASTHVRENYSWEDHVIPQFKELFANLEAVVT